MQGNLHLTTPKTSHAAGSLQPHLCPFCGTTVGTRTPPTQGLIAIDLKQVTCVPMSLRPRPPYLWREQLQLTPAAISSAPPRRHRGRCRHAWTCR